VETLDAAFLVALCGCRKLHVQGDKLLMAKIEGEPAALRVCRFRDEATCESCPVCTALKEAR